jgi:hypothetical protein
MLEEETATLSDPEPGENGSSGPKLADLLLAEVMGVCG